MPRGVNDAGGEFATPLADGGVRFSDAGTLRYFAGLGFEVVRLPFSLKDVMSTPSAPFNHAAIQSIHRYLAAARQSGIGVILDIHFITSGHGWNGDGQPLTIADFTRVWQRLATEFQNDPGLCGYDLFNEPLLQPEFWKQASQAAVIAIRNTGDRHLILVEGGNWANAHVWLEYHGYDAWIRDPADNFAYEAHEYFDAPPNGSYSRSFSAELATDPQCRGRAVRRLQIFVNWCEENGVRGFIGEFGCPAESGWLGELDGFLQAMDDARLGWTYWAAGTAWPASYKLSIQPGRDRPQLSLLVRHLKRRGAMSHVSDFIWGYRLIWRRARHIVRGWRDRYQQWREAASR
ncbi:MAG: glycoside hydrolase family 5 protein [Candidatus Xenobia bacterium]